jgi:hypothetical protein
MKLKRDLLLGLQRMRQEERERLKRAAAEPGNFEWF